jgi:anti-sigma factor RsiW
MASRRGRIEHHFAQQRMSDYVDGELSPRRRQRIERRAERCPECGPLRRTLARSPRRCETCGAPRRDRSRRP